MGLKNWLFGPPSRQKFAQLVQEAFAEAGVPERFRFDEAQFRLVSGDGHTLNLANFYAEYCRLNRSERKAALERWAMVQWETLEGMPDDVDLALPNLRPKIWMRWSMEALRLQMRVDGGREPEIALEPLGEHLGAGLVYDTPNAMATVSSEQIEKWGLTLYEAREAACSNLRESTIAFASIGESLHTSMSGDNYDATRLLLTDRIREFPVQGDCIAMVPNRDTLLITGSDDDTGLSMMLDITEKAMQDPRPMSSIPLRLDGDEWTDWLPSRGHPLFDRFKELRLQFLGNIYGDQKELLNKLHEKNDEDIFVATFSGIRWKTGEAMSYCVWGEGVCAGLLPETDLIAFARQNEDTVLVRWSDADRICGHLLQSTSHYPRRWIVSEFPNEEQWQQLQQAELPPD